MKSVQTVPVTKDSKLLMLSTGPSSHSDSRETAQMESWWGGLFSNLHEVGDQQVGDSREGGGDPGRERAKCLPSSPGWGQEAGMFLLEHCAVLLSLGRLHVRSDERICASAHLPDNFLPPPPPQPQPPVLCSSVLYKNSIPGKPHRVTSHWPKS